MTSQPIESLHISSITLAEIRVGIELAGDPALRLNLQHWLDAIVRPMFASRVLEVTEDTMIRWRLLVIEGRRVRWTYAEPDLLIASIASAHGLTVVTRNVDDFVRAGIAVFNPWVED